MIVISIDCDPPNDANLVYSYTPVAPETNGFNGFCIAGDLANVDRDKTTIDDEDEWDSKAAVALVADQAEALRIWRETMELPNIQVPEIKSFGDLVPYLSKWRNLARLVSVQARLLAEQGKAEEGLELAVDIVEFGRKQETEGGELICSLVGIAVKSIGLERIRQIAHDHKIPNQALSDAIKRLDGLRCDRKGMQDAFRIEYTMGANLVDQLADGDIDPDALDELMGRSGTVARMPFLFKRNQTKMLFVEGYEIFVKNCMLRYQDRSELEFTRPSIPKALLSGNLVGHIIYSMIMPALSRAIEKLDRLDMWLDATRIQLAITAYRDDHAGVWPNALKDLVPAYLEQVPDDPFSARPHPLRYSVEKKLVYSVGPDGVDGGGMGLKDFLDRGYNYPWKFADPSFLLDKSLLPKKEKAEKETSKSGMSFFE
jgi:hypothetical protein